MKIGLFICDCGKNISGVIDTNKLKEYYNKNPDYPDVSVIGDQYLCSELGLGKINEEISEKKIERVYEFILLCVDGKFKPEDINSWWIKE